MSKSTNRPWVVAVMLSAAVISGWTTRASGQTRAPSSQKIDAAEGDSSARIEEIRRQISALPPGSSERIKLAKEMLALRKRTADPKVAASAAPTTSPAAALPAWAIEQVGERKCKPIQSEISGVTSAIQSSQRQLKAERENLKQSKKTFTPAPSLVKHHQDVCERLEQDIKKSNAVLVELRGRLRDEQAKIPALLERLATDHLNGVVRCPACSGSGEITQNGGYVPSVTFDSGRSIGGVMLSEKRECTGCDGIGLVGRDAEYDRAITAVTPAHIVQKRDAMMQRWQSYLKIVTGKWKAGDLNPAFGKQDTEVLNEISELPQAAQSQRIRVKLSQIAKLTDEQVSEMIVDDGESLDLPQQKDTAGNDLFGP